MCARDGMTRAPLVFGCSMGQSSPVRSEATSAEPPRGVGSRSRPSRSASRPRRVERLLQDVHPEHRRPRQRGEPQGHPLLRAVPARGRGEERRPAAQAGEPRLPQARRRQRRRRRLHQPEGLPHGDVPADRRHPLRDPLPPGDVRGVDARVGRLHLRRELPHPGVKKEEWRHSVGRQPARSRPGRRRLQNHVRHVRGLPGAPA